MATPPSSSGSTATLPHTPPVQASTAISTVSSTVNAQNPVIGWSTGATTAVNVVYGTGPGGPGASPGGCYATVADVSVPQVGGNCACSGGFTLGGCQADEPAHAGFDFPRVGLPARRSNFSEYNSPRVGIMNLPVKMDNLPKMKGSFDLYAVQLRTFLTRMKYWEVVDGTFAR